MEQGAGGGGASAIFSFVQSFMDRSDMSTQSNLTLRSQSPLPTTPIPVAGSGAGAVAEGYASPSRLVPSSARLQHPNSETATDLHRQDQSPLDYKSEEYRQLFHLPPEEVLVEDFNCALQKKILLQGHMYLFECYICFYSNIFGYEKKKVIPLKDVTCVRKAKTAQVFPNAIEITAWGKKHFFASFLSRDEAYRLIVNAWSHHSGYARIYLGSQGSPGLSPRPLGPTLSEAAVLASGLDLQAPVRSILGDGFGSRDIEEVPSSTAPSLADDGERGSSQGLNDRVESDSSLEGVSDEGGPSTSSPPMGHLVWEIGDLEAPELPAVYKTVAESEFPIDVKDFFRLFLSNEAVGFTEMVHTKCGDEEFRCTLWEKRHQFGHAREISFRYPINFVFGPKATYCHETQRFCVYKNSHLVLESAQQMADIPYGDYFHVQVRWDVQALAGNGATGCFFRVSVHVPFTKRTVWRSKIEQGSFDGCKDAYSTWIREAHRLLQDLQAMTSMGTPAPKAFEPLPPPSSLEDSSKDLQGFERLPPRLLNLVEVQRATPEEGLEGRSGLLYQDYPSTSAEPQLSCADVPRAGSPPKLARDLPSGSELQRRVTSQRRTGALHQLWADWCPTSLKSWNQLKLVLIFIIAILLLQVCIMVAVARPRGVEYVPVGYASSPVGSLFPGANSGASMSGHAGEEISWIEQRARFLRDEVAMTEARLQTLQHDLAVLKMHFHHFHKSNPQLDLDL